MNHPIDAVEWIDRNELYANDYNPNHMAGPEMDLLKQSILEDGFTQPIVARQDGEIVDGFHRWTISADPEIFGLTKGLVPVVRLAENHNIHDQMMSTIRHNRARGVHGVVDMSKIVTVLVESGVSYADIEKRLGMEKEEISRLHDHGKMTKRAAAKEFNKGWVPK